MNIPSVDVFHAHGRGLEGTLHQWSLQSLCQRLRMRHATHLQAGHYCQQSQKSQSWSQKWLWPILQFLVENCSSGIGSVDGEFWCLMGDHVCRSHQQGQQSVRLLLYRFAVWLANLPQFSPNPLLPSSLLHSRFRSKRKSHALSVWGELVSRTRSNGWLCRTGGSSQIFDFNLDQN